MRCRICGCDCPPRAKICRDCAAARKRAFAQTVTQPLLAAVGVPSVAEPRFAPRPPRPRAATDSKEEWAAPRAEPAALPLTAVPRQLGALWLLVGAVVAGAIAALWVQTRNVSEGPARVEAPPPGAAMVPLLPPPIDVPKRLTVQASPMKVRAIHAPKKPAAPQPEADAAAVVAPAPEPAPVARTAPPPARVAELPRADPWQTMNEGLARCAREAVYDRVACEQRLRLQYCRDSWGLVPQCPIGPIGQELR